MARIADDSSAYDDLNITSMVDVAYTLLIVFIVITTAAVQGIRVNLPQAADAVPLVEPRTRAISITENGTLFLDAFPMGSIAELEARLAQHRAVDPQFPVIVRGDAAVQYRHVIDVLDMLGRLQLTQIGLVTQRLVR
jgi:biopolymer transport protein ExbD